MAEVWIIGAGGHAKVVIDALRRSGQTVIGGILDDDPARHGKELSGLTVRGSATLETIARYRIGRAIVAIGDNQARQAIVNRLSNWIAWQSVIHPSSVIGEGVTIGEGVLICAGVVIQPGTKIGRHAIVNTSSSIDHDNVVGEFAHHGPGSRTGGDVQTAEGVFLGINAVIIPGRSVGAWSTIGAGGVVVRDVPARAVAKGVPADW